MMDENESPVKLYGETSKRVLRVRKTCCLICGKQDKLDNLRNPKVQGLTSFINAFAKRKECNGFGTNSFKNLIDFDEKIWTGDASIVRWHPSCYSSYTNKQNIDSRLSRNDDKSSVDETRATTRSLGELPDLKNQCFLCGQKKNKGDTRLILIQYQKVIDDLARSCEEKKDIALKTKIGGDFNNLPALDAKYHSKCLKSYMRPKQIKPLQHSVHDKCFDMLLNENEENIFSGRAVSVLNLLEKYKTLLVEEDYDGFDSYTVQKLKHRLQVRYGDRIRFTEGDSKQQIFIYDSRISLADTINTAMKYKQRMKNQEMLNSLTDDINVITKKLGSIIKSDISNVVGIQIHPLDPEDISFERVKSLIPVSLINLLTMITGCKGEKDTRKIYSIAQDIIHLSSNGKQRMPKHVGLGISLKNNLRSKEFITLLNSLGQSISYDDVLRIETFWAHSIIESSDGYTTLPSNIEGGYFAQAASDNADYGQENNSQHLTNTVLYQYKDGNNNKSTIRPSSQAKIKGRRSISVPSIPLEELNNVAKPILPSHYSIDPHALFRGCASDDYLHSSHLTKAWTFLRITGNKLFEIDQVQEIPGWTGFRKVTTIKVSTSTTIGNCRSIPASPTDISVVYNMLLTVKKILIKLGQADPCVTVDESIYQLAKQVQWTVPSLEDITIRLGGFHRAKNFCGVIGKRMRGSGFEELLINSDTYGPNQVEGILDGKHYNRCVAAHKLVFEAVYRSYLNEFHKWLQSEDLTYRLEELDMALRELKSVFDINEPNRIEIEIKMKAVCSQLESLQSVEKHFQMMGNSNDNFVFWLEYLEMVDLLLNFIAAERESKWEMHLEAFQKMTPYDRAFDHFKYFTWGLIYCIDMSLLPEKHPDLYRAFSSGYHSVSRAKQPSRFNAVSTDMALEQSMNRDSKTKGGIIGYSQDYDALEKWALTAHLRASVNSQFKSMCDIGISNEKKELSIKATTSGEKSVTSILSIINEFGSPFKVSVSKVPLMNLATGSVVHEDNRNDILMAKQLGKESTDEFVRERLQKKTKSFWDPLPKLKLKRFSSEFKSIKVQKSGQQIATLKGHQNLFSRLLTVSSTRNIDLKSILKNELSAVPLSLFHPTGDMRKTMKSKLFQELEVKGTSLQVLESSISRNQSATIIDFMAVVQSTTNAGSKSFGDFLDTMRSVIHQSFRESNTVVLVPDRYDIETSIKSAERKRRGEKQSNEIIINGRSQKMPRDVSSYLSNPKNKINLVKWAFEIWQTELQTALHVNQIVFLANMDGSITVVEYGKKQHLDWSTDHEEADSKMFVFAKHLIETQQISRIVIWSPDTDVAIIALYQFSRDLSILDELWLKTGSGKGKRYVSIHNMHQVYGSTIAKLLPAVHCITGCDSTSSLAGVGKKTAIDVLKLKVNDVMSMLEFGDAPTLDLLADSTEGAIRFVCLLYDRTYASADINQLRFKLFTKKKVTGEKLPPTVDALSLHLRRAAYQCYMWKNACLPVLNLPTPVSNGWILTGDNELDVEKTTTVPQEIIELITCKCTKGCLSNLCGCRRSNLACSDGCLCNNCQNDRNEEDDDDESNDEYELCVD